MQWHTAVFWASLVLSTSYATWRGGAPERVAALLFVCAAVSSVAARSDWASRYREVEVGVLIVDAMLLAGLCALSLLADRFWPMVCAALQTIATVSHLARWLDPQATRTAYMLVGTVSGTPSLLILAIGVLRHRRRLAATGTDSSWRTSSLRSPGIPQESRIG